MCEAFLMLFRQDCLSFRIIFNPNLTFFTAGKSITFGGAVDRAAAVDCAVDLAASLIFWGLGAKGSGPGTQLAPRDPETPP